MILRLHRTILQELTEAKNPEELLHGRMPGLLTFEPKTSRRLPSTLEFWICLTSKLKTVHLKTKLVLPLLPQVKINHFTKFKIKTKYDSIDLYLKTQEAEGLLQV